MLRADSDSLVAPCTPLLSPAPDFLFLFSALGGGGSRSGFTMAQKGPLELPRTPETVLELLGLFVFVAHPTELQDHIDQMCAWMQARVEAAAICQGNAWYHLSGPYRRSGGHSPTLHKGVVLSTESGAAP